jgi:NADPH:quinone reductase-like Zn-dependent oxidoreductase
VTYLEVARVDAGQRRELLRGAASAAGVLAVQLAQWKGAEVLTRAQGRVDAIADVLSFVVQPNGTQLAIVAGLVDAGVLRPPLGRVLPLSDARLALELARSRGAPGKIVLSVSHP